MTVAPPIIRITYLHSSKSNIFECSTGMYTKVHLIIISVRRTGKHTTMQWHSLFFSSFLKIRIFLIWVDRSQCKNCLILCGNIIKKILKFGSAEECYLHFCKKRGSEFTIFLLVLCILYISRYRNS